MDVSTPEHVENEALLLFEQAEKEFERAVLKWYKSVVVLGDMSKGAHLVGSIRLAIPKRTTDCAVDCIRRRKRGYGYSHFIWPRTLKDKSPSAHLKEWLATIKAFGKFCPSEELNNLKELVSRLEAEDFYLNLNTTNQFMPRFDVRTTKENVRVVEFDEAMLAMKAYSIRHLTNWYMR